MPDNRITVIVHPEDQAVILVAEDGQIVRLTASTALALSAELGRLALLAGAELPTPLPVIPAPAVLQ